jgi:hypothetical protein
LLLIFAKGLIAMISLKPVFALSAALVTSPFAAAADQPPLQRAGQWQVVELGEYGLQDARVSTECVGDRPLLAKFNTIPRCSRRESHTQGGITTADAKCRVLNSVAVYHEKIIRLDDHNIYTYTHVTFLPPVVTYSALLPGMAGATQAESISFAHLKWLGACLIGETPLR